ncbi:hypothetical protein HYH02_003319 [Chlamydomonas schloesseri]|uniref:Uncharacterized protein n=1 Tax=Chlamydomonas schloesseri TaxID=2026947 RepID=A0A835WTJ4_9CHLO|nr:hypothetical protein HYH02_003319 [Chlamydomonas schloesseri]|eukprot:KAG2452295.1 hypothetical protein HYH02_003319 [Chlamydomonas schloesseri]
MELAPERRAYAEEIRRLGKSFGTGDMWELRAGAAIAAAVTAAQQEQLELIFALATDDDEKLRKLDALIKLQGGGSKSAPDAVQPRDQQEDIGMQRAAASRKFTGRVLYDKVDPETKKVSRLPSCVIVIAPKFAATFAHHRTWSEGQDVELEICCSDASSMRAVTAKVFRIDRRIDFVILKFVGEELPAPEVVDGPQAGMGFYGHGLAFGGNTANVYHGVIARAAVGSRGHVALDRLSNKGDSGGGIFSTATGQLLGMMIGRDPDREISYMVPAAFLLAATAEDDFDPDHPQSGEWM